MQVDDDNMCCKQKKKEGIVELPTNDYFERFMSTMSELMISRDRDARSRTSTTASVASLV